MCVLTAAASRSLPANAIAPSLARRFLRESLCSHAEDVLENAELLTSEVVTNAVSYAGPPISITIECDEASLTISVHDGAHDLHPPVRGAQNADERLADGEINLDERGRGLAFVDLLASRMSVTPDELGKTVTFALDFESGAAA